MISVLILPGCGYRAGETQRGLVIASDSEDMYVLDAISGRLYELWAGESSAGWYRELPYKHNPDLEYFPIANVKNSGAVNLYATDDSAQHRIIITRQEDGLALKITELGIPDDSGIIAVDDSGLLFTTTDGLILREGGVDHYFAKPEGEFSSPVATKGPGGEWLVIWPERVEHPMATQSWSDFAMIGAGFAGKYTVQRIVPGAPPMEYHLVNETYRETRATELIGALMDPDGRFFILDDKGYITIYQGEKMITNFFGQLSPSQYVVNTIALGPGGNLLVTDAVSHVITMLNPSTGRAIHTWRIPVKRNEVTRGFIRFGCIIDVLLAFVIIILIVRISGRMRRYREYRKDSKNNA
jgi:hypothetical protein